MPGQRTDTQEVGERGEPVGLGVELQSLGPEEKAWIDIAALRMKS